MGRVYSANVATVRLLADDSGEGRVGEAVLKSSLLDTDTSNDMVVSNLYL